MRLPSARRGAAGLMAVAVVLCAASPAGTEARKRTDSIKAVLDRAERGGLLEPEVLDRYRAVYRDAVKARGELRGSRKREMAGAIRVARKIASDGRLTTARMPAVFLTLERNAEYWTRPKPPGNAGSPGEKGAKGRRCRKSVRASASRVRFDGSELLFQRYPGIGLQLHPNAEWSTVNGLLSLQTPEGDARAAAMIDELFALSVVRAGALTWEYYFPAQGGRAPWVSALSQGGAVAALTLASQRLNRPELLEAAGRAARLFGKRQPEGVAHRFKRDGIWFQLYSFRGGLVLNSHLRAVSGLHDYVEASGDPRARYIYREGLRAARRWIGRFDTGRWSRYAIPGGLSDLNYHVLNRDMARGVCKRTGQRAICRTADRFARYLDRRCPKVRSSATEARPAV